MADSADLSANPTFKVCSGTLRRSPTFICAALLLAAQLLPLPASGQPDGGVASQEAAARQEFERCQRQWPRRERGAWLRWRTIAVDTAAGREARVLLRRADAHYVEGLYYFEEGSDDQARSEFQRGLAIAPMDPHHHLELADIYWDRGLRQPAVVHYGRYLAFITSVGETVDPETLQRIYLRLYPDEPETPFTDLTEPARPWWHLVLFALAAALPLLALLFAFVYLRRGQTLAELMDESPDLHPRIAYAIGCLRHELLKHRLGALGDVVSALRGSEGLTPDQLRYLYERLYGGESLSGLWRIYIDTFDRLSGKRLNLSRRDREFRRAWLAVRSLETLREGFEDPDKQVADKLDTVRESIRVFDRHLKSLAERLCRSQVDGQLLREAVFSVQGESRAAAVRLDEIRFEEPPPDVYIEVFRTDMLIILRNLVRNAILALGRQENSHRALKLEVTLRTEPTGDESVLIKIYDTSPEALTTDDIYGRRLERGFGLVAAAVTRYDGSIFVESADDDFRKALVVRFFRAMGEAA